jgi:putative intracellular protease/amidase
MLIAAATAGAAQAPTIQVQGRIQVQYRMSSGDSSGNYNPTQMSNGFEVRRLRIQTNVRFGDNINLVIQPSFEMGALRMRDAFLRVGLTPRIGVAIGQEKSPFQRYELTSSNNLLSIERGVRILRLAGREGLNDVLAANGYASHDLGAFVDFAGPDNKVTFKAGVQNGSRESSPDVNNAKSYFARATATAITNSDNQPVLQLGASFAARDRAICAVCTGTITYFADSSKTTTAFGVDAEWGGFRPGFHVIADFATGDNAPIANRINSGRNTANLRTSADTALRTFMGFSLVGAYRINTTGPDTRLIKIFEPAVRVDYLDPDTDTGNNEGILITPVLNIYFANTVVLRAGLDFYSYKDATGISRSAKELKFSWQANF